MLYNKTYSMYNKIKSKTSSNLTNIVRTHTHSNTFAHVQFMFPYFVRTYTHRYEHKHDIRIGCELFKQCFYSSFQSYCADAFSVLAHYQWLYIIYIYKWRERKKRFFFLFFSCTVCMWCDWLKLVSKSLLQCFIIIITKVCFSSSKYINKYKCIYS